MYGPDKPSCPAQGHERRFGDLRRMSDLHPASDVSGPGRDFAVGPIPVVRLIRRQWHTLMVRHEKRALDQRQRAVEKQPDPTSSNCGSYLVQQILRSAQVPICAANLEKLFRFPGTLLGQQLIASG